MSSNAAPRYRVGHHFAPATATLLAAHPNIGEVRSIDAAKRWAIPADLDILFALGTRGEHVDPDVRPPPGWPGQLKFIQLASAGTDEYPPWLLDHPCVATAAGTSAPAIAEYVLACILAHEKRLGSIAASDDGQWVSAEEMVANPLGELDGKVLGLIGIGEIGGRVARLAAAFGMRVVAARRSDKPSPDPAIALQPLDTVLASADHLVVAAPLTNETHHLLGSAAFGRLKQGVHIVNIARGQLIDQPALIAALESGRVAAASLDVTDPEPLPPGHPLWRAPNVRITPHIAWSSPHTPRRIFSLFADNVSRLSGGQPIRNRIGA